MKQLALPTILEQSFRARQRAIHTYIDTHKVEYQEFARFITPDVRNDDAVWTRVAFAILSANAPFDASVKALHYVRGHRFDARWEGGLDQFAGMVPAKLVYLSLIDTRAMTKSDTETWLEYRVRLARNVKGLGWAKASFTASLLYPLESDLACIDTHMQKVYLGHSGFRAISQTTYLTVEEKVRKVAQEHFINTFLAQWLIWDHTRGKGPNAHTIFPGAYKDTLEPWEAW